MTNSISLFEQTQLAEAAYASFSNKKGGLFKDKDDLEKALKVLRSRLYELELAKKMEADSARRKSMVSSGDRSAKIRTYNYPQGRVTDHRIGLTLYDLQNVINGDVQRLIDELQLAENAEKLKEGDVF